MSELNIGGHKVLSMVESGTIPFEDTVVKGTLYYYKKDNVVHIDLNITWKTNMASNGSDTISSVLPARLCPPTGQNIIYPPATGQQCLVRLETDGSIYISNRFSSALSSGVGGVWNYTYIV